MLPYIAYMDPMGPIIKKSEILHIFHCDLSRFQSSDRSHGASR